MSAKPSKRAARAIHTATLYVSRNNSEAAARVLGAAIRASLTDRDVAALRDAARSLAVTPFACEAR